MFQSKTHTRVWKSAVLLGILFAGVGFVDGCGRKGGGARNIVQAVLCGDGHSKGLLSIGFNPALLTKLRDQGTDTSNAGLSKTFNSWLAAVGIPASAMNIKSIESIAEGDKEKDDTVRFVELGGTLGKFGTATSYLIKALRGQSFNLAPDALGLSGENALLTGVQESFGVRIADEVPNAQLENLQKLIAPDFFLDAQAAPHPMQWALQQTKYAEAISEFLKPERLQTLTKPIVVAVVDTGVDMGHPDLKDLLLPGKNFVSPGQPPQDGNGHGTHCAGIIAAQGKYRSGASEQSPLGVAAPLAALKTCKDSEGNATGCLKILPVKVLDDKGAGESQNVEKGIRWAAEQGADVISLSLGGGREWTDIKHSGDESGLSPLKDIVISEAVAKKSIVVVAAGNESCALGGECKTGGGLLFTKKFSEYIVHPCSYEDTICVGASDPSDKLASYSNFSSHKDAVYRTKPDVVAPGTNIYSTWPTALGSYKTISGTSMATPFVAGIAALIKANHRDADQAAVKKYLAASQAFPDDIKQKSDVGRVDLFAVSGTMSVAPNTTLPPPSAAPHPVTDPGDGGKGEGGAKFSLWDAVCHI